MLNRARTSSKRVSKTEAVQSVLPDRLPADAIHIGPSDYVPWLEDRKWAHIRLEGRSFGDQPINVELKLEVWDSPNSAGVVIDAIRSCKIAMDRGIKGALLAPSAYLMKSPPQQWSDEVAHTRLETFINGAE
jgi:myo-inositol-1-phosphate synthase